MVRFEKNPTAIVGLQQSANSGLLYESQMRYWPSTTLIFLPIHAVHT